MARKFPRNEDEARIKILNVCKNLIFAETAKYKKPVGKKQNQNGEWVENFVEGLSIRFAEESMARWGNSRSVTKQLFDDENQRIVLVGVIDLETNAAHSKEIHINKTIERKSAKGREGDIISERLNSRGDRVFILRATEDEIRNKLGSEVSKAMRDCFLRLLPAYIKQEAIENIDETIKGGINKDPDASRRKLTDAFAALGVLPSDLEKYLGQSISSLSPAQIAELREVYAAIKTGETTWAELVKQGGDEEEKKEPAKGNLNDFKAGDPKTHTPVSAPLSKPVELSKSDVLLMELGAITTEKQLAEFSRKLMREQVGMGMNDSKALMEALDRKQKELQKTA